MTPTTEDLYGALWHLGSEQEIVGPITQETIAKLQEFGMIEIRPGGHPALTSFGDKCYSHMEAGECVPEFGETRGEL